MLFSVAARGCSIAIHYNSDAVTASSLADSLRGDQHQDVVRTEVFQADLGDYEQVKRLHAEVVEKMSEVSILFNNGKLVDTWTNLAALLSSFVG